MSMYSLFKEWDGCHSIQVEGGKRWKSYHHLDNPEIEREELTEFEKEVLEQQEYDGDSTPFIILMVSTSLIGSGLDGEGFMIAVDENNKIIAQKNVWMS